MKLAAMFLLVVVTFCVGYRKGYSDGCRVAVTEQTIPASSDGVSGPFLHCQQQYEGPNSPVKSASISGEDPDVKFDDDPFGIAWQ